MTRNLPNEVGWVVVAVFGSISLIATVTFALRVYVRTRILKQFGTAEDWAAGAGWFLSVCFSAIVMVAPFYGMGKDMDSTSEQDFIMFLKIWWLSSLVYYAAAMAVKLTITLMLLRFIVEEYHKKLVYVVGISIQVYSLIWLFISVFQCQPVSFFWTRTQGDKNGGCMNESVSYVTAYMYSGITIIFDVTMAVLPWFIVRKMQINLRTRIMVAGVLALGSIASIATIIRVRFIVKLTHSNNLLYDTVGIVVTSSAELGLSIVASSAVALKPLFRQKPLRRADGRPMTPRLNHLPTHSDYTFSSGPTTYNDIDSLAVNWKIESEILECRDATRLQQIPKGNEKRGHCEYHDFISRSRTT